MLSKPYYGWTNFQVDSEGYYALSYLTDIAGEWLSEAIYGLETDTNFVVSGFCEPGEMVCTVCEWCIYVIYQDEEVRPRCKHIHQVYMSKVELCKNLYFDISANLEDWVDWREFYVTSDHIRINARTDDPESVRTVADMRRRILQEKLNRLKELIANIDPEIHHMNNETHEFPVYTE